MNNWLQHLPMLPIVVPLMTAALLVLLKESRRKTRLTLSFASVLMQVFVAYQLLLVTAGHMPALWPDNIAVYLLGDWPAPFGIVLVADRLAAVMLLLCSGLGLASLIYSTARWERAGVHFLPLYQLLLMGLNGAFLTGDLFNLFVF